MLTEVMRHYGLTRPPIDAGFFETEHHAQVSRDIRAAIMGGRLIALTAVIGSGKTILSRRLRADLERDGRIIVSRSLSVDKAKISVPLLLAALFYDLTPEKTVKISSQSERRERDYIDWVLKASLDEGVAPDDVLTDEAATMLAAELKTPLQIGQHLVRAFEAGFEIGAKPIDAGVVEAVLSSQLNDLESPLTRNGYDLRSLMEQFDAKPAEIRRLLRGDLDAGRSQELMDEMRAAGLPT